MAVTPSTTEPPKGGRPIGEAASGVASLPLSLKRLLIDLFSPDELRQLAHLKEALSPRMTARQRLNEAGVDELDEMLVAGRRPTVEWWRRHAG